MPDRTGDINMDCGIVSWFAIRVANVGTTLAVNSGIIIPSQVTIAIVQNASFTPILVKINGKHARCTSFKLKPANFVMEFLAT